MDAVAARAGVSKATIYVHFQNKRALFEAIVHRRTETVFGALNLSVNRTDVRQMLTDLARTFIGMLLQDDTLAVYRAVLAETVHQPEVGEAFYHGGPAHTRRLVGEFFVALENRGLMDFTGTDAFLIADLFLSMLAGDAHLKGLFIQKPDETRINRVVDAAVDLVLTRCSKK
jgi:TetR/AcrR family transcriptional repressor of mexJK operon